MSDKCGKPRSFAFLAVLVLFTGISLATGEAQQRAPALRQLEPVSGRGCFTAGDDDTPRMARANALSLAQVDAVQNYRIYVESATVVKNLRLESDIIRTTAGGMLRNQQVVDEPPNGRTACVKITAAVDPQEVDKFIQDRIKAAKEQPLMTSLPPEESARAIKLASGGSCQEAMPLLQKAAVVDTENAELYFWIGRCQNDARDFATASQTLAQAISRNSGRSDIFVERARSFVGLELNSRAMEDLDRALGLDSRNLGAVELRGDLFMKIGRYNDAVGAYYEAFQQGSTGARCAKLAEAYRRNGAAGAATTLERSCSSLK